MGGNVDPVLLNMGFQRERRPQGCTAVHVEPVLRTQYAILAPGPAAPSATHPHSLWGNVQLFLISAVTSFHCLSLTPSLPPR